MRAFFCLLALGAAASSAGAGEVTVTVAPDKITLVATATPVSDVLDQLARKTGMKIIYDGAPPRLLVSPRVERETASQAVLAVLEGLGVAYVLITDRTASRVETLFIASGVGGGGSTPAASRPPGSPAPAPEQAQEKPRPQPDIDEDEEMARPPMPQEPEPPKPEPPRPQLPPTSLYPTSPFAPVGQPQPVVIPGQPSGAVGPPQPVVIPGQPFIPGLTQPSPPPPPQ